MYSRWWKACFGLVTGRSTALCSGHPQACCDGSRSTGTGNEPIVCRCFARTSQPAGGPPRARTRRLDAPVLPSPSGSRRIHRRTVADPVLAEVVASRTPTASRRTIASTFTACPPATRASHCEPANWQPSCTGSCNSPDRNSRAAASPSRCRLAPGRRPRKNSCTRRRRADRSRDLKIQLRVVAHRGAVV